MRPWFEAPASNSTFTRSIRPHSIICQPRPNANKASPANVKVKFSVASDGSAKPDIVANLLVRVLWHDSLQDTCRLGCGARRRRSNFICRGYCHLVDDPRPTSQNE